MIRAKTQKLIDEAKKILLDERPMTVRQVFYQLVSRIIIPNSDQSYNAVKRFLATARLQGQIPFEWIEDRLRQPRTTYGFIDAAWFLEERLNFRGYHRHPWTTSDLLVELWVEKDALSGIFGDYASEYYLTLNVGRGYDGWSSIHEAAMRYANHDSVIILYFGDFDPSGEDMPRSLEKRFNTLGCLNVKIKKCALTREQIELHNLPPALTKKTDRRARAFIRKHGDMAVELDALPPGILRALIEQEIRAHVDMAAFYEQKAIEKAELEKLSAIQPRLKKLALKQLKG